MHPGTLAVCLCLEARALPADAEWVVDRVALYTHRPPASRAANGGGVSAEAIAHVLRPHDVLDRASRDLGEPAAFGTRDHRTGVAAGRKTPCRLGAARRRMGSRPRRFRRHRERPDGVTK